MRVPVRPVKGKARKETPYDQLSQELSQYYEIVRDMPLEYADDGGTKHSFTADIAIPKYKMIVEFQGGQDNKTVLGEMKRERIARANGWHISRVTEKEMLADIETVFYKVRRDIERTLWK
jgi:hypothetical protein